MPNTFFIFKSYIPLHKINKKYLQIDSMIDSGSFCNFISPTLVKKLNLIPQKIYNKLIVKGISGNSNVINEFINLKFK